MFVVATTLPEWECPYPEWIGKRILYGDYRPYGNFKPLAWTIEVVTVETVYLRRRCTCDDILSAPLPEHFNPMSIKLFEFIGAINRVGGYGSAGEINWAE